MERADYDPSTARILLHSAKRITDLIGEDHFPAQFYLALGPTTETISGGLIGSLHLTDYRPGLAAWQLTLPTRQQVAAWQHFPDDARIDRQRYGNIMYGIVVAEDDSTGVIGTSHNQQLRSKPMLAQDLEYTAWKVRQLAARLVQKNIGRYTLEAATFDRSRKLAMQKLKRESDKQDFQKRRYHGVREVFEHYVELGPSG